MALGQQIGVFFLIVLMSFVFYNDITRIFGS
jgi:membrane-associated protease RseP (regulator of RpoE activity)